MLLSFARVEEFVVYIVICVLQWNQVCSYWLMDWCGTTCTLIRASMIGNWFMIRFKSHRCHWLSMDYAAITFHADARLTADVEWRINELWVICVLPVVNTWISSDCILMLNKDTGFMARFSIILTSLYFRIVVDWFAIAIFPWAILMFVYMLFSEVSACPMVNIFC